AAQESSGAGSKRPPAGSLSAATIPDGTRHVEAGFSFVPPASWKSERLPGDPLGALSGPIEGDAGTLLSLAQTTSGETLAASVDKTVAASKAKGYRLIDRKDFETSEGLSGIRLIAEKEGIRVMHYVFEN